MTLSYNGAELITTVKSFTVKVLGWKCGVRWRRDIGNGIRMEGG
jgi:hypothetical protein